MAKKCSPIVCRTNALLQRDIGNVGGNQPEGCWILEAGQWSDTCMWIDTEHWID